MENPDFTIGTEQYNQKWILDAYGESFYNLAKDEQVSCSGVTIGDHESIKVYINKMIEGAIKTYALLDGLFQYFLIFSIYYFNLSIERATFY